MNFTVTSTRQTKALKVVVYGPEGIGKTTFANNFPQPIYIDTEGSTNFIDSQKLPDPTSWTMLLEELEYLKSTSGIARTIVIDTMDWAENLAKQHLMAKNNWDAIDASSYGTRYVALADEIGKLLNKLSELVELNYNVVLLAHSETKKHELPDELGAFDRYVLKLERRDASLVKEWADMILFANFKTTVITDSKTNSKKATGGQRVMYTTHKPTWDAKNRLGLADELPFDYEQIRVQLEQAMHKLNQYNNRSKQQFNLHHHKFNRNRHHRFNKSKYHYRKNHRNNKRCNKHHQKIYRCQNKRKRSQVSFQSQ